MTDIQMNQQLYTPQDLTRNDYVQTPLTQADMPKKGTYTFWLVLGFITGVLWGGLAISPYNKMNQAIADNDSSSAWQYAKKVRMFALIGCGVNAMLLILSMMGS